MTAKPPVCPPCQQRRAAWLDSKPSQVLPTFGIAHGSGAPYDTSLPGLLDRRRSRHQQWVDLVREQMAGIAADCRRAQHVTAPSPLTAVVVQVDPLEALERVA